MKLKTVVFVGLSVFCCFCAILVVDAVKRHPQQAKELVSHIIPLTSEVEQTDETPALEVKEAIETAVPKNEKPVIYPQLTAVNADEQTVELGAVYEEIARTDDPEKYKFHIQLTNKGAAIRTVTLSEFTQRQSDEPMPLTLLAPLHAEQALYSLANTRLKVAPAHAEVFGKKAFPLDKLNWRLLDSDEKDTVRFEAVLKDGVVVEGGASPVVLMIVKTYRIEPGSYDLTCEIAVENLSSEPIKVLMEMQGPGGILREAVRQDARKVKAAYHVPETTEIDVIELDAIGMSKKIKKNDTQAFGLKSKKAGASFAWSALTNKYFAAIVRPIAADGGNQSWLRFNQAQYFPPPGKDKDDQNCSYTLMSEPITLAAAGDSGAEKALSMQVYLGPKDKRIFEKNETYRTLQYFKTIDFRACCCPVSVIAPLAFGIMWLMNTMYTLMGPLGNYGIVIMILVFVVRLILHPITKKSQVSMMGMQKLGPRMQEIQKKYANNKEEMNKRMMALYREAGVSPVSGMLPMFLQMPIWIALWTAVYTSIDLRGAGFLPFWITDLSMPDQLFAIPYAEKLQSIDYIGSIIPSHFNLLPILMGVVMYVQQKMMPTSQTSAQTNPQMAQQQKMMMIMMPLMFPLMLYNGPSGVNLYIMSSIGAGVLEQRSIRKHIQEKEEEEARGKVPVTAKTGGKVKKKKPKPFFKG